MQGGERYYSISNYLKETFGGKTIKLSLDAGFTCPNRDGTLGTGGCAFCSSSGSGEFASALSCRAGANDTSSVSGTASCSSGISTDTAVTTASTDTTTVASSDTTTATSTSKINAEISGSSGESGISNASISEQIQLLSDKWPDAHHIAYFQNHTNTYAPVETLRRYYYSALRDPRIDGIAIATRPDCLGTDVLDLLEEIHREHFLWVELGLQTIHARTSEMMGIGYPLEVLDDAVRELQKRGIRAVLHIILGLPGESREDMFATVRHVAALHPFGVKFHMLNLVRGSRLYEMMPDYVPFRSIEEYSELVVDLLEILPPDITVHRLTADTQRGLLVAPEWSYRKRTILNTINRRLKERNTCQGAKYAPPLQGFDAIR